MARAARAMVTVTRVAGHKEGDGDGNSDNVSNGNGNECGGSATAMRAMTTGTATMWAMASATRVAGDIEGNG
jgi:hypothetical protein